MEKKRFKFIAHSDKFRITNLTLEEYSLANLFPEKEFYLTLAVTNIFKQIKDGTVMVLEESGFVPIPQELFNMYKNIPVCFKEDDDGEEGKFDL